MSELRQAALEVVRRLTEAGHEAYFAGGAVRDMIMRLPPGDIDIATSARPEEVMALFRRTVAVGASFGVVVVLVGRFEFQVATFRSDGAYVDGRHPGSVTFSTARKDAERRDFTINGLMYDPATDRILDFVGGQADIQAGVVRCIGEPAARFSEDKLRLIRAVRFAARFDFEIEEKTWAALTAAAADILSVSWERIRDELVKILTGPRPHRALSLLETSGLLGHVLPEVAVLRNVDQPSAYHPEGDVLEHVRLMLEHVDRGSVAEGRPVEPELALAVLLHDVGKAATTRVEPGAEGQGERITSHGHEREGETLSASICRRLRLPNTLARRVTALVRDHVKPMHARSMRPSTLKKLLRAEHFQELLELHRLDRLAGSGDLDTWRFLSEAQARFTEEDLRPAKLLSGEDLKAMGYAPGPAFGRALEALEEAQLEGRVADRAQAETLVRRLLDRADAEDKAPEHSGTPDAGTGGSDRARKPGAENGGGP